MKASRVYNKRTMCVKESIHVIFDESDKYNPTIQVDDYEIGLVQPSEKNADSQEEEEVKEERNEEVENDNINNVPVPQGGEDVPVPQNEGTESIEAIGGTIEKLYSEMITEGFAVIGEIPFSLLSISSLEGKEILFHSRNS